MNGGITVEKSTCPCCGYKSLDSEHFYDVCPICYWTDDYSQFLNPDLKGGANNVSLREAQKNFMELGACDKGMTHCARKPKADEIRDENWKPL